MSVAFRRDGDEEHLEPKFEIPLPPGPNLGTPRGLQQIAERIAELESHIDGRSGPDAEVPLKAAQRELRYWQTRQVTAELVPEPSGQIVAIGTSVTFTLNGKERRLTIVGDDEADPAHGLVSFSSPLARALMDAEVGESLDFNGREDAIAVLAISTAF